MKVYRYVEPIYVVRFNAQCKIVLLLLRQIGLRYICSSAEDVQRVYPALDATMEYLCILYPCAVVLSWHRHIHLLFLFYGISYFYVDVFGIFLMHNLCAFCQYLFGVFKGITHKYCVSLRIIHNAMGMMLPAEATFIPVYYFYSKMGLVDNWIGLILPSLVAMFGIFMFKNAFEAIPVEVMEAARMDKAKNRTIMLKIMVPMISPVIITHFITSFISNWNEYYWVLVMTNSESLRTLPVALRGLLQVDEGVPQWNVAMAGTMIQLAPILLMYIFASGKIKTAMVGDRKIKI